MHDLVTLGRVIWVIDTIRTRLLVRALAPACRWVRAGAKTREYGAEKKVTRRDRFRRFAINDRGRLTPADSSLGPDRASGGHFVVTLPFRLDVSSRRSRKLEKRLRQTREFRGEVCESRHGRCVISTLITGARDALVVLFHPETISRLYLLCPLTTEEERERRRCDVCLSFGRKIHR